MSLLQPFEIGGLRLRNRVIRSATWEGLATPEGHATPALASAMASLARGHIGLVITSHSYVHPSGHAGTGQLSIANDAAAESHRALVAEIHGGQALACAQLAHAGRVAISSDRVGPSNTALVSPQRGELPPCREATAEDLDTIVAAFVAAAVRARSVGYDAVQIHSAHGYLLSQFLSPAWNKRTDEYGGPLENRARLLLRVARAVREAVGAGYPVLVKLNTEDFVDGGLTVAESSQVVAWLHDQAGVCLFEASGGTSISRFGAGRRGKDCTEGYHREGAAAWKRALEGRPAAVALVGGVRSLQAAQELVDSGACDMVSLSRPLIREPDLVAKWERDASHRSECISCSVCFEPIRKGEGFFCPSSSPTPARRFGIDDVWPDIEAGMQTVLRNVDQSFPMARWMQLYTAVYNHCTTARPQRPQSAGKASPGANFVGEDLYARVTDLLKRHMKTLLKAVDAKPSGEGMLQFYVTEWQRYTLATKSLNHIFQYLNRHWIKREADDGRRTDVCEVYSQSLVIWRDHFFNALKTRLTNAVLALVEAERNGDQINAALVGAVIATYVSLGLSKNGKGEPTLQIYKEFFCDEYVAAAEAYYARESASFIASNSVSDYMRRVETRLAEEVRRCKAYLHPSTEQEVVQRLEQVLIEKHLDAMWSEFLVMLQEDRKEDLARVFSLLSRVQRGLDPLRNTFENHVQTVGLATVEAVADSAGNDPKLYVDTLIKIFRKFNDLTTTAFKNEPGFVQSLDKACRKFMNDNAVSKAAGANALSKSPELLAKFTDVILKKSMHALPEQEMEKTMGDVMVVFKYIEDKDVFQTFYSRALAKRLIQGTSASSELEESMISKLRSLCGLEYTTKLQKMFTDMGVSASLMHEFADTAIKGKPLGLDFSMLVLTTHAWPLSSAKTNFVLPPEMIKCQEVFTKFFNTKFQGRKLNWLHQLSKADVAFSSASKVNYTFTSSTYQAGILLLFNQKPLITREEIQDTTQLTDQVVLQTLQSLVKLRILLVDADADDFPKSAKFQVNPEYKNKKTKVIINVPAQQQVREENTQAHRQVEEERKWQVMAAIVRIMKMRRELSHVNLVAEVIAELQTHFKPRLPLIKKEIDSLIEKEYLERVEGKKDMYSYIA
eukprot:m51a1_g12226 putative cullin a (1124) ;mRNA; r:60316-65932